MAKQILKTEDSGNPVYSLLFKLKGHFVNKEFEYYAFDKKLQVVQSNNEDWDVFYAWKQKIDKMIKDNLTRFDKKTQEEVLEPKEDGTYSVEYEVDESTEDPEAYTTISSDDVPF